MCIGGVIMQKTIINFPKNKLTAEVINAHTMKGTVDNKTSVFAKLSYNAQNSKFDIKKLNGENDCYPFLMSNKNIEYIINFEEKDNLYKEFNDMYLTKKIKKENNVKNFKLVASRIVGTVLLVAMIGSTVKLGLDAYFKESEANDEKINDYLNELRIEQIENGSYIPENEHTSTKGM